MFLLPLPRLPPPSETDTRRWIMMTAPHACSLCFDVLCGVGSVLWGIYPTAVGAVNSLLRRILPKAGVKQDKTFLFNHSFTRIRQAFDPARCTYTYVSSTLPLLGIYRGPLRRGLCVSDSETVLGIVRIEELSTHRHTDTENTINLGGAEEIQK